MDFFASLLLFIAVLLFYLNLMEENKRGNEMEVFEMNYLSKHHLNEACRNKQPFLFPFGGGVVLPDSHYLNTLSLDDLSTKYGKEEVAVIKSNQPQDQLFRFQQQPVYLTLENAVILAEGTAGSSSSYVSCDNHDFVLDTALHKYYQSIDEHLKPFSTLQTFYDFSFGSAGSSTPLQYHKHHATFMYVCSGSVQIKCLPYRKRRNGGMYVERPSRNSLDVVFDSTATAANIWQETNDFLEVVVPAGFIFYLPPYWWNSVQYETKETWVATFHYNTAMNRISQLPNLLNGFINVFGSKIDIYGDYNARVKAEKEDPDYDEEEETKKFNEMAFSTTSQNPTIETAGGLNDGVVVKTNEPTNYQNNPAVLVETSVQPLHEPIQSMI